MKCYKLTDKNNQTRNGTQWGHNVSHSAEGKGENLCSDGWIHFYTNPLIALLLNPIHANFSSPKLWEAESSGEELHESLKSGCKTLTTIKEIPLPEISDVQKIAFGILCGKEVYKDEKWNLWADKWLSGEDRTTKTAAASHATAAAHAAVYAAHTAVAASAYAAAGNAAAAAAGNDAPYAASAYAAPYAAAAAADDKIDFIEIAEKAMTYK